MKILEQFMQFATNHEEALVAARNAAQVRLADDLEVELGVWIDMGYAKRFDELTKSNPSILENLANEETHDETIKILKTKLYH